jgi:FixJ family two-component response regulator
MSQSGFIAVVDDDALLRWSIVQALLSAGYLCVAFASAEDLLRTADRKDLSCVVSDIGLEGISGLELPRRLAAMGVSVPIIFMTASREPSLKQRAFELGGVSYLQKPFKPDVLIAEIAKVISTPR